MAQVQPNGQLTRRWTFSWRLALKLALFIAVAVGVLGVILDTTGIDREGLAGTLANGAVLGVAFSLVFPAAGWKERALVVPGAMFGGAAASALVWLATDLVF